MYESWSEKRLESSSASWEEHWASGHMESVFSSAID